MRFDRTEEPVQYHKAIVHDAKLLLTVREYF
jgi:hypothetical protein